jgi:release factor glutamine methyltransferase
MASLLTIKPSRQIINQITPLLAQATERLAVAGCPTPRLDAEILLATVLDQEREWLYTHPEKGLTPDQLEQFLTWLNRRERREPVAYLTGHKEFFGLDFKVNHHVLIPRPETELLVETVIQKITKYPRRQSFAIADIGTGSGCIAIALAKHLPPAKVWAVDISPQALTVAQHNARQHQVTEQITFVAGDLLAPLDGSFDFIISNPPYVSDGELATTMPEVQHYEPAQALAAGPDGLAIIRRLLAQTSEKLKPGGSLIFEIGAGQGQVVVKLAGTHFFQVRLGQDLAGLDRIVVAEKLP